MKVQVIAPTPKDIERFWTKVAKTDECWEWLGVPTIYGYGQFQIGNRPSKAHRVSYTLRYGPIPEGLVIDHICQNRICVRPDHLRAVTHKQNSENRSGPTVKNALGVRGVRKVGNVYVAEVKSAGKTHVVGRYSTVEAANDAAVAKRNELFSCNETDKQPIEAEKELSAV